MAIRSGAGASAPYLDPEAVAEQAYDQVLVDILDVKRHYAQAIFDRICKKI